MLLFHLFAAGCVATLLAIFIRPKSIFEFPYFMGATFAAFILPQAYGIYLHSDSFPAAAQADLFLMCCLCLAACYGGYYARRQPQKIEFLARDVEPARVFQAGAIMLIVGFACTTYLNVYVSQVRQANQWTGTATKLHFFAQLVYPGFALCLLHALAHGGFWPWGLTLLGLWNPIQTIIFAGRREPAALTFFLVALALFFVKGRVVSRWISLSAIIGAALFMPSTADYRQRAGMGPLAALEEIPLVRNFMASLAPEKASEVKNAMVLIEVTSRTGDYQYGAGYWNMLVFRFVPAQFVGLDFKNSLMIGNQMDDTLAIVRQEAGFEVTVGSLVTGMGDVFRQFGWLGALFFVLVGLWFRRLWITANSPHANVAQILYVLSMVGAMRAVTHQTTEFLPEVLYGVIFLGLVLLYAKKDVLRRRNRPAASRAPLRSRS